MPSAVMNRRDRADLQRQNPGLGESRLDHRCSLVGDAIANHSHLDTLEDEFVDGI